MIQIRHTQPAGLGMSGTLRDAWRERDMARRRRGTSLRGPPPPLTMSKQGAFEKVPIVDVSGLQSTNKADREAVAAQLADVASNVGFLYATGHGVSEDAIRGIQEAAREFFALPEEERMQVYIGANRGKTAHKGYVPEGEEVFGDAASTTQPPDHKSAFDFGMEFPDWEQHPLIKAGTPMLGYNQWPTQLGAAWRGKCLRYYDECFAFGMRLWRGFALALGLDEEALDKMVTYPPTSMRMIHYPYTPQDPATRDAPGIGAHTCVARLLAGQRTLTLMVF